MVVRLDLATFSPSGGFAKAIKARFANSFIGKETKMKQVQQWLFQVEAYLKTQHFDLDNDQIHFVQTFFIKHGWDWWMVQK
jgi:hypothetical protein